MKYVLLVNHHQHFSKAFGEAFLRRHPEVAVQSANDAASALKLLGLRPCDMIIADSRLPEVDGVQLLLRVRQRYPHIARILMAADVTASESQKAIQCGAIECLEKPSSPSDYDAAVDKIAGLLASFPEVFRSDLDPAEIYRVVTRQETGVAHDCMVAIYMGFDRGTLMFHGGRLIHAETQALKGQEALREILSWHDGLFEKHDWRDSSRKTLDLGWQEVFAEWKKELRKKPTVTTALISKEFSNYVAGKTKDKPDEEKKPTVVARKSEVAPKPGLAEKFPVESGVHSALQLDSEWNVEDECRCRDPKIMKGVAAFTMAKAEEIGGIFQWGEPLNVHYVSDQASMTVFHRDAKTFLVSWPTAEQGVIETINRAFPSLELDPCVSPPPKIPGTIEAMKMIPNLHGYAIFKKPLHMLVKKFAAEWAFEMLETSAKVASQMGTVLRLQGLPLRLTQVKFAAGSVLSRPVEDMLVLVICHSQTKVPLLKDCMLRITAEDVKKAVS